MPLTLSIPELGSKLKLAKPWTFTLYSEHRNETVIKMLGHEFNYRTHCDSNAVVCIVKLPKGTVLTLDRIYIRKGASEYSSLSFMITQCSLERLSKGRRRFWAKLDECNQIKYELV